MHCIKIPGTFLRKNGQLDCLLFLSNISTGILLIFLWNIKNHSSFIGSLQIFQWNIPEILKKSSVISKKCSCILLKMQRTECQRAECQLKFWVVSSIPNLPRSDWTEVLVGSGWGKFLSMWFRFQSGWIYLFLVALWWLLVGFG